MELTYKGIQDTKSWQSKGIKLPAFAIAKMNQKTADTPQWIHFGAGNIFRGFIGSIAQNLLNNGDMETGIIAAESFDFEIIDKIYKPYDNLTLNVTMGKSSELHTEVLAGIANAIKSNNYQALKDLAESPSLQLISFTITEKGYAVRDANGNLLKIVENDIRNGIENPKHTMSIIASMLYCRYKSCAAPIAIVSMDNCSHNGEKLKNGVMTVVEGWLDNKTADAAFIDYLNEKVSFPWSMIDKITPRPDNDVKARLEQLGVQNIDTVITDKNTYIAPFVNAEIPQYLVIEDDFPNGRPPFEKSGVYMTTREIVNKAETMKVTTCLNPLHTGLAVFGCLLGYTSIWKEMRDNDLLKLVSKIANEGMKVVTDPEIIDPRKFVNEVIGERLPNPNIPDTPQRIAADTSQKIPVRYGETIKSYTASPTLDTSELSAIPMVIAAWLRYLLAVDDNGNKFEPSADPMLADLKEKLGEVELGSSDTSNGKLKDILSNEKLFGVNLYSVGLGEKIETLFASMIKGKGAVREVLKSL